MPQMNKGGKFIFGKSLLRADGRLCIPPGAAREYEITADGTVVLFPGSRSTGGFCVTRPGLLGPSRLGHILDELPALAARALPAGAFVRYKGRAYCWLPVSAHGTLRLTADVQTFLGLAPGQALLCIRSSDIAFTLGARGPLLERAAQFPGTIEVF